MMPGLLEQTEPVSGRLLPKGEGDLEWLSEGWRPLSMRKIIWPVWSHLLMIPHGQKFEKGLARR